MILNRKLSFISGLISGLAFAPLHFLPGLLMFSVLAYQVRLSSKVSQSMIFGYLFGFGFFLSNLYWIAFGVSVYIDEFWWAIPFALFGLPAFMAIFIAFLAAGVWRFRTTFLYHVVFCIIWVFFEWLVSWIFTGLPWSLVGYVFSFSEILIQPASVIGVLGLSFIAVFIGSSFCSRSYIPMRIFISVLMIGTCFIYGYFRLKNNPTEYSAVKVRIVQPSIPQIAKWDANIFWNNLNKQVELSKKEGDPDIIVWSEAALIMPYNQQPILDKLASLFSKEDQILLLGGVNDNGLAGDKYEIYSSLIGLNSKRELLFDYHKAHLVPFGEYMPLKSYLPIKKITHGIVDYTPGTRQALYLEGLNLRIWPLICYESIFFSQVRIPNSEVDIIINITNDAWYGKSSGPYQHFQISRMRAVENGLPLIRAGNNGISGIIDPLGRVLNSLELNEVDIIDSYIPYKLNLPTIFSNFGILSLIIMVVFVLIMHFLCFFYYFLMKFKNKTLEQTCSR